MRLAVVGSRSIEKAELSAYISREVTEIVSGGAKGVDRLAAEYARTHGLALTEFLPQYEIYGRSAPLRRNEQIVTYADAVLVLWDGKSKGARHVMTVCWRENVPCQVVVL